MTPAPKPIASAQPAAPQRAGRARAWPATLLALTLAACGGGRGRLESCADARAESDAGTAASASGSRAGTSGPGAAAACTSAAAYATGLTYDITYGNPNAPGTTLRTIGTVNGTNSTFHSLSATEIEERTTVKDGSGTTTLTSDTKFYQSYNATTAILTRYGFSQSTTDVVGGLTTVDTFYSPAVTDGRFALATGANTAIQTHQIVTRNGTVLPATDDTDTVTFVGVETLDLGAAGSFQACKFTDADQAQNKTTTTWLLLGKGVVLKSTDGTTTSQATAVSVSP